MFSTLLKRACHMSGETLGWSSNGNDPVAIAVSIGKLQTFCRNLEDRIKKNEDSKDDLIKISVQLDELKGKTSELKARMTSIEDLIDEVEGAKKVLKMLNPKNITCVIALVMGGSVGGNTVIESLNGQEQVIKKEVDQQDLQLKLLTDKINKLEDKNN
jgi:prefoldin subunit 5